MLDTLHDISVSFYIRVSLYVHKEKIVQVIH